MELSDGRHRPYPPGIPDGDGSPQETPVPEMRPLQHVLHTWNNRQMPVLCARDGAVNMTGTITSFVFSALGAIIMYVALKDGFTPDMKTLILILAAFASIMCSWLSRIEASIDKLCEVL